MTSVKKMIDVSSKSFFLLGFTSLIWYLFRTGTKPSRAVYPCQRAAASNSNLWISLYVVPLFSPLSHKLAESMYWFTRKRVISMTAIFIVSTAAIYWGFSSMMRNQNNVVEITLNTHDASITPTSNIFVVKGTTGNDDGVNLLIDLMNEKGHYFYQSSETSENKGPEGLIGNDDVIIIKINCQWDERGGTNTDLIKSVIQAIINHPDGFVGEIVVADNGQAQFGSAQGGGGSFEYSNNNAEDYSQSVQKIVDSFSEEHKVSAYLWDIITTSRVDEYDEGDVVDGYIVNTTRNLRTQIMVSYPKFKTKHGTYVSFKLGIWNIENKIYETDRLKVINLPVLKTHGTYDVTASVKHYMGVVSDKLTAQLGTRSHNTIRNGGMGTEMVETRLPVLNIVDAIWINAHPGLGPRTGYNDASRINVIAASTDPIALDYWAAKNILMQVAQIKKYGGINLIDPDNIESGSFGSWLRLSMQELILSGYQSTVNENQMNVYITQKEKS